MGGSINMAFRFSDGEACCFNRWTNNMGVLSCAEILEGDEGPVRDYIAMCRNNDYLVDPSYMGRPVNVSSTEYGLVIIDYLSKTIIDCNSYTSLFGNIHAFSIREGGEDDWYANNYTLIRKSLERGRGVIEKAYRRGSSKSIPTITRYDDISSLPVIMEKSRSDKDDLGDYFFIYEIDTAPWTYFSAYGDRKDRKRALELARGVNFPMNRKMGLNANYPSVRKKKVSSEEIKARFLWMKMKSLPEYSEFDGVPWEKLSRATMDAMLERAKTISSSEYDQMRAAEFLAATPLSVIIKAS